MGPSPALRRPPARSTLRDRGPALAERASRHSGWLIGRAERLGLAAAAARTRAALLGFATVAVLGFNSGGYSSRSWGWTVLAFTALVALGLLLRDDVVIGSLEWVTLGALASLAIWMLISSLWGIAGTDGPHEAERTLVYLSGLAALLVLVETEAVWALLAGVLAGTVLLAAYGLGDRALNGPGHDPFEGSLLVAPLGYANALGILVAIGLVIAAGIVVCRGGRRTVGLALVAAALLGVALVLTSSRGAVLALVCGLLVLGALLAMRSSRRNRARLVLPAAAVVCIGLALAAAPRSGFGDRTPYWRAALHDAHAHPLSGSGAGSFHAYWSSHRTIDVSVQDAHSLYLETLAELGPVGLLLVLLVLVPPYVAGVIARSDPAVPVAAGGYAAFLVHAGIDWDWEMPATTVAGLACAAAMLVAARPSDRVRPV